MAPFTKILVPTDFSRHSENAANVAADLGRRYDAPVSLLHVWRSEYISVPGDTALYDPADHPKLTERFQQLIELAKIQLQTTGARVGETALIEGSPAKEICKFAHETRCDLIVMGSHGRSGIERILLGSVAEHVVRHAPCAVLAVRLPERGAILTNAPEQPGV